MMISELDLSLVIPALLAGILVLSVLVPLGQEVLKRGIIFIDLAIAQIAALGVMTATLLSGELIAWQIQLFAGLAAIAGAGFILYLEHKQVKSLEAIIGLLFVLAATAGLLLVQLSPDNDALLHDLLVGQILWVGQQQLLWTSLLYLPLLFVWFVLFKQRRSFVFYLIFSLAVTAAVQLVGIYLVFASLIVPAWASQSIKLERLRLIVAYSIGFFGYVVGLVVSLLVDLPTGAITVWTLMLCGFIANQVINRAFMAK